MTTFARVPTIPGPVLEIYVGAQLFEMHPDVAVTFHVAPDDVGEGWGYDGTTFTPPTVPAIPLKLQAVILLQKSDLTVLRCAENDLPVPPAWAAYRSALRQVIAGTGTTLPAMPGYPAGT